MVYNGTDEKTPFPMRCGVIDNAPSGIRSRNVETTGSPNTLLSGDCQKRTFRLAVAATGEFTTWAGNQLNAMISITNTVNNINAIYERDLGVHFTLVTNNSLIFTDPATDPYETASSPTTAILSANG